MAEKIDNDCKNADIVELKVVTQQHGKRIDALEDNQQKIMEKKNEAVGALRTLNKGFVIITTIVAIVFAVLRYFQGS